MGGYDGAITKATSKRFTLYINTDNEAFSPEPEPELSRLLRKVADRIERGHDDVSYFQTIHDSNGNNVGRFALKVRS